MRGKCYTMCTIIQNDDGEKFIREIKDIIQDIQSKGLYAEVQYNNPITNEYSALVMSYKME
jgi:hypothetical protein